MKPLLMAVLLHPKRECLAKSWIEKEPSVADVIYLPPRPVGEPIYGRGGTLYTAAAINRACFEAVLQAWREAEGYQFFGVCMDDVVVTAPSLPLAAAVEFLRTTQFECAGGFNADAKGGEFRDYCARFWVACKHSFLGVHWDTLWDEYDYSEFEGPWMKWSGVRCALLPGLEFHHLVPRKKDLSQHDVGWDTQYYRGREVVAQGYYGGAQVK